MHTLTEAGVVKKSLDEYSSHSKASEYTDDVKDILALEPTTEDVNPGQVNTDGRAGVKD